MSCHIISYLPGYHDSSKITLVLFSILPFITLNLSSFLGQRFAILEEKTILAHVLRHFRTSSVQPFEQIKTCAELVTRPKGGIIVSLSHRKLRNKEYNCINLNKEVLF